RAAREVAPTDTISAARLLVSAARVGAGPEQAEHLAPLSPALAERLLKRAGVIAARWASDGVPPQPFELRRLSKILDQSLPKL
ncbi:MAG: hypothetical protein V2A76_04190, partial [Planctomycetota bacterium]